MRNLPFDFDRAEGFQTVDIQGDLAGDLLDRQQEVDDSGRRRGALLCSLDLTVERFRDGKPAELLRRRHARGALAAEAAQNDGHRPLLRMFRQRHEHRIDRPALANRLIGWTRPDVAIDDCDDVVRAADVDVADLHLVAVGRDLQRPLRVIGEHFEDGVHRQAVLLPHGDDVSSPEIPRQLTEQLLERAERGKAHADADDREGLVYGP